MTLGKRQWQALAALCLVLSLICFGRVFHMMRSNYRLAHTLYFEQHPTSTPSGPSTRRPLSEYLPRTIRLDPEFDWENFWPWILGGTIAAGASMFLFVTAIGSAESPPNARSR